MAKNQPGMSIVIDGLVDAHRMRAAVSAQARLEQALAQNAHEHQLEQDYTPGYSTSGSGRRVATLLVLGGSATCLVSWLAVFIWWVLR